jgi:hypothetical protein
MASTLFLRCGFHMAEKWRPSHLHAHSIYYVEMHGVALRNRQSSDSLHRIRVFYISPSPTLASRV